MKKSLRTKEVVLVGFLLLIAVFLFGIISGQIETIYCAEKTANGAWCQNVPQSECNTGTNPSTGQPYRCDRTSCESTSYCSEGTCANTATGECLPGPQANCNPEEGGVFYDQPKDEVNFCQVGCCLIGDGAALVERNRCNVLGKDNNVVPSFLPNIQDEIECLSMASPEEKGACVFETERGRECEFTTRGTCQESGREFSQGLLCSNAPELGTICAKTQRTTCVSGKNEVYFVDSCGNLANVYDANKIDDVAYWSYVPGVEGVEVDLGDGEGNAGSRIFGACDYIAGSTCGSGNAQYGNNICRSLGCSKSSDPLTYGIDRRHGAEWCSEPIDNFENAKPGKTSYLLYCFDGEVQYEICDYSRNSLCNEDLETSQANCISNNWQACGDPAIETTKECLDAGDCKVEEGSSIAYLRTPYGTDGTLIDSDTNKEIVAACLPIYTPGFNFWDPEGTILDIPGDRDTPSSLCEFASVSCFVEYLQGFYIGIAGTDFTVEPSEECVALCREIEDWSKSECRDACTPKCLQNSFDGGPNDLVSIETPWAESYQNLCVSIGDCGVSSNYLGEEGYNRWKDLFRGNPDKIKMSTLPNAEDKK